MTKLVKKCSYVKLKISKKKNKGTGSGGSNTNKNGLSFERKTNLDDKIIILKENKNKKGKVYSKIIKFDKSKQIFERTEKYGFKICTKEIKNKKVIEAHGCKLPDAVFIDKKSKNMFIIEKKSQNGGGSVCEKIQTSDFKLWQFKRTFPNYDISYIYCLSDWFKNNCKAEIEYLKHKKVPVFWGNSETYKDEIINFIINFKK